MLYRAIRALLAGQAGITALVGIRIFALKATKKAEAPYLIFQAVGYGDPTRDLDGPGELVATLIQIDCYAATAEALDTLVRAVRLGVDGFRGEVDLAGSPSQRFRFAGFSLTNRLDFEEDDTDPKLHRTALEFSALHQA